MKVIDLLQRIANGEIPKTIVYDERYFTYDDKRQNYFAYDDSEIDWKYTVMEYINDKIEIIEEKEMCHKCGKYPAEYNQTYCEFCLGISEEDKKIEKLEILPDNEHYSNAVLYGKVNEIIDKINKEK